MGNENTKKPPEQQNVSKNNLLLKILLLILLIIIIILLLLRGCAASKDTGGQLVLEPDYELVKPDDAATAIPDETDTEKPEVSQGGGSMSLIYSDQVRIDLASGKVGLYYQNPSRSTQSVVLQVIIQREDSEYLVAESGSIEPGFMLTELDMADGLQLAAGGYEGILQLFFFDPTTGERAIVDTNIPVDITVQ